MQGFFLPIGVCDRGSKWTKNNDFDSRSTPAAFRALGGVVKVCISTFLVLFLAGCSRFSELPLSENLAITNTCGQGPPTQKPYLSASLNDGNMYTGTSISFDDEVHIFLKKRMYINKIVIRRRNEEIVPVNVVFQAMVDTRRKVLKKTFRSTDADITAWVDVFTDEIIMTIQPTEKSEVITSQLVRYINVPGPAWYDTRSHTDFVYLPVPLKEIELYRFKYDYERKGTRSTVNAYWLESTVGKKVEENEQIGGTAKLKEIIGKDGAPMVMIPAGKFQMGYHHDVGSNVIDGLSDENTVRAVYLDAFYIDKYEVTNAQYARFLNEYGKETDMTIHTLIDIDSDSCKITKDGDTYKPEAGYEKHPVVNVTWYGAAAYAQYYGKRLPTQAEWERAARGMFVDDGKYKGYVWGDEWPPPKGAGNFADESAKKKYPGWIIISGYDDGYVETAPVGSFNPNGYGLYDMAGNVWEWCADEYVNKPFLPLPYNTDMPIASRNDDFTDVDVNTARVLRGGCWSSYDRYYLHVGWNSGDFPHKTYHNVGFRCSGL